MATTNSPPTLLISNAIATLSKSLNTALAKAEDDARVEIARAVAETREALRERDDVRKTLHESQLEEQAWKQEVAVWKAKVEKVDMTNKHQTETISQLRQEARQWQDQCIRLEETSRDWKEQFLRVEQERQILLARIDELVTEKMIYSTQASISAPFYTPNSNYNEIAEPSTSSATTKRASSNPFQTNGRSVLPPSPTDQISPSENLYKNAHHATQRSKTSRLRPQRDQETEQVITPSHLAKDTTRPPPHKSSATKTPRHQTQTQDTSRSQRRHASSPTRIARQESRSEPRQQVIRRVTATFEVPVKEEEIDDDEYVESASASTSVHSADLSPTTEILHALKAKSSQQRARQQSRRSVREKDDDSYVEEEEDGKSHVHANSSEEEDDELMMGAEDNRKEVYGTHRVVATATPVRPNGTSTISRSGGSSTKKRKQVTGRASGGSATKTRRL